MGLLVAASVVLGVGAWIADRLLRPLRAPTRWLWAGLLVVPLALAVVAPWRSGPPAGAAPAGVPSPIASAPLSSTLSSLAEATSTWPDWLERTLSAAWFGSALVALATIVIAHGRVARVAACAVATRLDGVRVRVSEAMGPVVVGLSAPELVIPRWVCRRPEVERRMILAHEAAHVAARDPLLLLGGAVAAALAPWNPIGWWAFARLRLAIELDCDGRVLRAGASRQAYGELLLALTAAAPRLRLGSAAFAAHTSHLERRILAMSTSRPSAGRRALQFTAAMLVVAAAIFTACSTEVAEPTRAVAGAPAALGAASPASALSTPYFDFQVDWPATPVAGSGAPRYPAILRSAGVEGEVLAQFVVDESGRVRPETFKAVRKSHDLFEASIRSALPGMRFTPAQLRGRAVPQLVQQPFVFQLAK